MRIAVIVTCHNRRELTIESIRRVLTSTVSTVELRVFVTDDGSTDGTAEALAEFGTRVQVIRGAGDLYWAAGMALAERAAMAWDPDFLLWLNDDTLLDTDGLRQMLEAHKRHPHAVVVGATRDPETGAVSYAGRVRTSSWHPQRFAKLPSADEDQFADTINGNVVLVPRDVRDQVGPIDGRFPHAYADDDYGLRVTGAGLRIVQPPGTVASCRPNPTPTRFLRGPAAWRELQQPKGLPWKAQARFLHRHGGRLWPLVFVAQQVNVLAGAKPVPKGKVQHDV